MVGGLCKMTPLDVITLQQAKDFLKVDFSEDDNLITTMINASVSLVEQKTQYRFYQRIEVLGSDGTYNVDLFQTPLNSVTVTDLDGNPYTEVQIKRQPVRTTVEFILPGYANYNNWGFNNGGGGPFGDGLGNGGQLSGYASSLPYFKINVDCGYIDVSLIPNPLIEIMKTLISDWYENRDIQQTDEDKSNLEIVLAPYNLSPMF